MILWILIIVAVVFFIRKQSQTYNYWKIRNIKQKNYTDHFNDNISVFLRRESFFEMMKRLYDTFPNER